MKRMLDCQSSDFQNMTRTELLQMIHHWSPLNSSFAFISDRRPTTVNGA